MSRLALVTGGAGFIGSHLVEGLLAEGYRVRVLDDFSTGHEANLAAVADRIEVLRGCCTDRETVARAMVGVDVVFHEAARASVQHSVDDPTGTHRTNLDATLLMLDAARRESVSRFVFAASSAAYGDAEQSPKTERMPPDPLSPYAVQKLASEAYCRAFARCYGLATVALRYFNVYGPRQDPSSPYSGVISLFITRLLRGEPARIFGDGQQTRDFVYVQDIVRANLAAASRDVPPGTVANVGCGRSVTIAALYAAVQSAIGPAAAHLAPIHEPARKGDVRHSAAAIEVAKSTLGYAPSVSLDAGIRRTVDYYRKEKMS